MGEVQAPPELRYLAVRLPRRSINLSAGIEDHVTGEVIQVANASMAIRLARLMNDETEGTPLPERAPQHVPIRFQLAHDPAFPSPGATVLYVHRLGARVVAYSPSEDAAHRIARLLTHVDYPMDERLGPNGLDGMPSPPKAHDFGDKLTDLPLPSLVPTPRATLKPYRRRVLGMALWSWIPLIALAALAGYIVGWVPVVLVGAAGIATTFLIRRSLRQ